MNPGAPGVSSSHARTPPASGPSEIWIPEVASQVVDKSRIVDGDLRTPVDVCNADACGNFPVPRIVDAILELARIDRAIEDLERLAGARVPRHRELGRAEADVAEVAEHDRARRRCRRGEHAIHEARACIEAGDAAHGGDDVEQL